VGSEGEKSEQRTQDVALALRLARPSDGLFEVAKSYPPSRISQAVGMLAAPEGQGDLNMNKRALTTIEIEAFALSSSTAPDERRQPVSHDGGDYPSKPETA
jgi:hypothetical protein